MRFDSEAAKGSNLSEWLGILMGTNRIHRILKNDYVMYIFRYDIEISHRYRHWLSLTKAIKSFKKQDKYVRRCV